MLITSDAQFEVETVDALRFLKMRSHCTGNCSTEQIAERSQLAVEEVESILASLREAAVVRDSSEPPAVSIQDVRRALGQVCEIWSAELRDGYVGNRIAQRAFSRTVVLGWLLEMYHYIRDFPYAIAFAAERASGELKGALERYAGEERGHEEFVVRTLLNMGLSRSEIEGSAPLVATRTVSFLMRDLFAFEPAAAFLMAALVEARDYDAKQIAGYTQRMEELYGFPAQAWDPYFEHQKVDYDLGHWKLLAENERFIQVTERERLDLLVDKLHDLKHGFDLQSLEILSYYEELNGKYFPRQKMQYFAI